MSDGKIGFGLGIHGEPGQRDIDWVPAPELARLLVEPLLAERPAESGGRVAVIVNGLGATKYEEVFVLYGFVAPMLREAGLTVVAPEVGELVTSLDMGGVSLTLMWLDDELEPLWLAPASTPAFTRGSLVDTGEDVVEAADETLGDAVGVVEGDASSRELGRFIATTLDAMRVLLAAEEDGLGRLDAIAGDGDHGRGMLRGPRTRPSRRTLRSPLAAVPAGSWTGRAMRGPRRRGNLRCPLGCGASSLRASSGRRGRGDRFAGRRRRPGLPGRGDVAGWCRAR